MHPWIVVNRRLGWLALFVATWITLLACGASEVSDLDDGRVLTPTPTPSGGRHHPDGWAAATAHGRPAKFVVEDCRSCHGLQLDGGSAGVSCDGCHAVGWKTDCTFCHGGVDNQTGAPPRDITDLVTNNQLVFRKHTQHVTATATHSAIACLTCHVQPGDALAANHWFDTTPAYPEVTFSGLAAGSTFGSTGSGACSTNYCHGNGQAKNGAVNHTQTMTCRSCHLNTGSASFTAMSGDHDRHIRSVGATCSECHGSTVDASNTIIAAALHVDGLKQLLFSGTNVTWNSGARQCSGTCHGKSHSNDGW